MADLYNTDWHALEIFDHEDFTMDLFSSTIMLEATNYCRNAIRFESTMEADKYFFFSTNDLHSFTNYNI